MREELHRREPEEFARPRLRRAGGGGHVLRLGHDRPPQGVVYSPTGRSCCARWPQPRPTAWRSASGTWCARSCRCPMSTPGPAVHRHHGRIQAGVSRAAPGPGEPARPVRPGARHTHRRRADDLAGHLAGAGPPGARSLEPRSAPDGGGRGAAAPESLIRGLDRHGLRLVHAWGMTEMTPIGTVSWLERARGAAADRQSEYRAKQGLPLPFVETRIMKEKGEAPWDGKAIGELEVRGPWVASQLLPGARVHRQVVRRWVVRTGDVATIDREGYARSPTRPRTSSNPAASGSHPSTWRMR